MYVLDPGWLRPLLVLVLVVLGVILRFTIASPIRGFGLRRFRTPPDAEIAARVRRRVGEMLLIWAAWVVVQMAARVPESWITSVWAPLLIIVAVAPSYTARLYAERYLLTRHGGRRSLIARTAWLWVVLREALPLGVILLTILVVRRYAPALPPEVPVGWDTGKGTFTWMQRDAGLDLLRHRTMLVYGLLFGLEGVYLIVSWIRDRQGNIAVRMLSRSHWLYFMFRFGWVLLFAGFNLGFLNHAWGGGSLLPFLLPGIFCLAALGILVGIEVRRAGFPFRRRGPG